MTLKGRWSCTLEMEKKFVFVKGEAIRGDLAEIPLTFPQPEKLKAFTSLLLIGIRDPPMPGLWTTTPLSIQPRYKLNTGPRPALGWQSSIIYLYLLIKHAVSLLLLQIRVMSACLEEQWQKLYDIYSFSKADTPLETQRHAMPRLIADSKFSHG
ncbi:hypothetical protein VNO77_43881 [Canavalia gladiata]|uniref:Uncharacterized protein n=1 Tax=Canavalia gladiata TaxID=3824 RepID=A0AAN9JX88_CANGL